MPQNYIYFISSLCYAGVTLGVFLYSKYAMKKIFTLHIAYVAVFTLLNGVIIYTLTIANARVSDIYILYALLLLLELFIAVKCDKEFIVFGVVHVSLHIVCTRNFSVCLLAILKKLPLDEVLLNINLRFASLILSMLLFYVIFAVFIALVANNSLIRLLEHKKQLRFVYTIGLMLLSYQIFCTKALYYKISIFWFVFLQLLGSALILLGYYFVFSNSLLSSVWITQIWQNTLLERQLERQLTHYRAYERSEQTVRIFKHDFKKLTAGVSRLLAAGQKERALALLEQMDHALQNNVKVHLHYSSNLIIDAVMQELANECDINNIVFKASVFPPEGFSLSSLECSAMFSSLAKMSSSECKASNSVKKHISISTSNNDSWFTIITSYTFDGGELEDKKIAELKRSLEYLDVLRTAENYGGFATFNYANNEAKLAVHLSFAVKGGVLH